MRRMVFLAVAGAALCGCGPPDRGAATAAHGRYVGVGTYAPGALWSRMVVVGASRAPAAATPADDEHVIVVVDSRTGEIRECGDYSGLCVSLQPWTAAVAPAQRSPVTLTKHLGEVAQDMKPDASPVR